jgi:Ca2+-binding RTX toxin-like protein
MKGVASMRRILVLLAAMALTLAVASGVALAVNEIGTNGPDTLRGTNGDDLSGSGANDVLWGGGGRDNLLGGTGGNDIVLSGNEHPSSLEATRT